MPTNLFNHNSTTRQPLKMLVVGHSPEQLHALAWLNDSEYRIDVVNNGLMALQKFDEGYDLLLMKSEMTSGLSGLQVLKILQEMRPQQMVPVILV